VMFDGEDAKVRKGEDANDDVFASDLVQWMWCAGLRVPDIWHIYRKLVLISV